MDLKNKRFMVIGGAGFIGSHVVEQLLREAVKEIIIYDNLSRGKEDNIKAALQDKRCTLIIGDILHKDLLKNAMQGIDGVFHLAAVWLLQSYYYPETAFDINIRGTFNVAMCAIEKKVKKVVFSSSASVYGNAIETPIKESHPYNNETFYGATKIAGEHIFRSLGIRYGLKWLGLRYMNVYGIRQDYQGAYTSVIHKVLDKLDTGKSPVLFGTGLQTYDFIDVEDVALANLLAMKSKNSGNYYNIGTGIGTSLRELAQKIITLKKSKSRITYRKSNLIFVTKRIGDTRTARRDLSFHARISLHEGLKKLIRWRQNVRNSRNI